MGQPAGEVVFTAANLRVHKIFIGNQAQPLLRFSECKTLLVLSYAYYEQMINKMDAHNW